MPSAKSLVFSTPELLELILSHLPLPSLLLIRPTSPYLNNLIQTSPLLQQKLFFRSHTTPSKSWHANPLLRQHFSPFFPAPQDGSKNRPYEPALYAIKKLPWTQDDQRRGAFLRKDASWRNMCLISHASSSLRVVEYVHARGGDGESIARIPFDSNTGAGVTMGIVYDIVHSFLERNSVSSFNVAYRLDEGTGEVGITLGLYMTVQCVVHLGIIEERVSLRSEGEGVTVGELEWGRRGEGDEDVPGRRDVWETELTEERGGVA